jgi:AraC-like DNA-binding protein
MSGSDDDLFCKVAPVPISAVNPAAEEIGFRAAEYMASVFRSQFDAAPMSFRKRE